MGGVLANSMIFPVPNPPSYDLSGSAFSSKLRKFEGTHSSHLCAWYGSGETGQCKSVLVYFHGNASDIGSCATMLEKLKTELKVDILAPEYPGYGRDIRCSPSEESVLNQSVDICNKLWSLGIDVHLFGYSIGSGPAVYAASRLKHKIKSLTLLAPFTSIRDVAEQTFSYIPRALIPDYFNNQEAIAEVTCPIVFIHGTLDQNIPISHSRLLLRTAIRSRRKILSECAGVDHFNFDCKTQITDTMKSAIAFNRSEHRYISNYSLDLRVFEPPPPNPYITVNNILIAIILLEIIIGLVIRNYKKNKKNRIVKKESESV